MTARILDGRALAATIEGSLRDEVTTFVGMFKRRPRLVVVLVGDLAASASYVKSKQQAAARVGIDSDVLAAPATTSTAELVALVEAIAAGHHGTADGILVQLPLPPHVDTVAVLDAVPPDRDVDGFHPENAGLLSQGRPRFIPCTAAGVQRMILDAGLKTAGRHVVIVGPRPPHRVDDVGVHRRELRDHGVGVGHRRSEPGRILRLGAHEACTGRSSDLFLDREVGKAMVGHHDLHGGPPAQSIFRQDESIVISAVERFPKRAVALCNSLGIST